MDLGRYREQHEVILGLATDLSDFIGKGEFDSQEGDARNLLARLAGKVNLHLTMEDDCLYPRLCDHPDAAVKDVAARFANEMGEIANVFVAYVEKWRVAGRIAAQSDAFVAETNQLFYALKDRIERENNELYPLAERSVSD